MVVVARNLASTSVTMAGAGSKITVASVMISKVARGGTNRKTERVDVVDTSQVVMAHTSKIWAGCTWVVNVVHGPAATRGSRGIARIKDAADRRSVFISETMDGAGSKITVASAIIPNLKWWTTRNRHLQILSILQANLSVRR